MPERGGVACEPPPPHSIETTRDRHYWSGTSSPPDRAPVTLPYSPKCLGGALRELRLLCILGSAWGKSTTAFSPRLLLACLLWEGLVPASKLKREEGGQRAPLHDARFLHS